MPEINQPAPSFTASNQTNTTVSLSDFRGKQHVVLYFYPKDDTTGCTLEARQFTALVEEFSAADSLVLGVSKDDADSHCAFINKYGLGFDLLTDTDGRLCQLYDVWREKEKNGERYMGILRSTFIIDKQGILAEALYDVAPDGHAVDVLERVRKL